MKKQKITIPKDECGYVSKEVFESAITKVDLKVTKAKDIDSMLFFHVDNETEGTDISELGTELEISLLKEYIGWFIDILIHVSVGFQVEVYKKTGRIEYGRSAKSLPDFETWKKVYKK